ncbi:MAG: hydrogenase formation protein HypD [bacterium]
MAADSSGMRYTKWFRDGDIARGLFARLEEMLSGVPAAAIPLMEVCGTHTVALFRSGIRRALPKAARLISGPGCPVCVTPNVLIDKAIAYANEPEFIVTTFGDMMRVPGSETSLEKARGVGADVRIVYSTMDALETARENPDKKVVFFGIGFETTAPTVAAAIIQARAEKLNNFAVVSAHKTVPAALEALAGNPELKLKGFICPGHVSVIIGSRAYLPIVETYNMPCVITGFEPLDLLQGIMMLVEQALAGRAEVRSQYSRAVSEEGNRKALDLMNKVFEPSDSIWRGIGPIPGSGLAIREEYADLDAEARWPVAPCATRENPGCRCAEVLMGLIEPPQCALFKKVCTPEAPVGACMVSSEGTCAAYFKYGDELID